MSEPTPPPAPPGAFFTWKGREWVLPRQTIGDREQFHAIANALALADLDRLKEQVEAGLLSEQRYAEQAEQVRNWVASGHYSYWSRGGAERLLTASGVAAVAYLALRRAPGQGDVTYRQVAEWVDEDPLFFQNQLALANSGAAPVAADVEVKAGLMQARGLTPGQVSDLTDADVRDYLARPADAPAGGVKTLRMLQVDALLAQGKTKEEIKEYFADRKRRREAAQAG